MSTEEIHPRLAEIVEDAAAEFEVSESQILSNLKRGFNLDLTEVSDEDAERFADAMDDDDPEAMREVLEDNDVPEDAIDQFLSTFGALRDADDPVSEVKERTGNAQNGESAEAGDAEYATKAEVEELKQQIPSADDVAESLQRRLGGGSGGAQSAQGGGDSQQAGGMNPQTQAALQLAQTFLQGQQGGGQMAELGEMMDKAAKKKMVQQLTKPSLGDIIEMRMYEKMGDKYAEEWAEDMFSGDPLEELEEADDDEDGGWWPV